MADTRLNYLEDLDDYKVASEDPDVRGWKLVDQNNTVWGTVDHLLADVKDKRVRYLDIEPEEEILKEGAELYRDSVKEPHEYRDREGNVHMIVPIGMARIDEDNKQVIADRLDRETFTGSPQLRKGTPVTMEQEKKIQRYFEDPVGHRESRREEGTGNKSDLGEARHSSSERQNPTSELKDNMRSREVKSDDDKHREKITPENSGVPNVDSRGKNVDSSRPETGKTGNQGETPHSKPEDKSSRDTISASGRSMRPERSNEGKMTSGAPDSLEAGATSAGAQGSGTGIEPRTTSDRENMRNRKMDVEGELENRKAGKEEDQERKTSKQKDSEYRESDEAAARRVQAEKNRGDYSGENYDEDRFYNRK